MDEQEIMSIISAVCFSENINNDRKRLHKDLLNHLKEALLKNKFDVQLERPQKFEGIKIKNQEAYIRDGFIDLVANKKEFVVGIEFDSGLSLKFKSIEKLIQSDCKICVGIVRGGEFWRKDAYRNSLRIKYKINENTVAGRSFWLIILSQKYIESFE